MSLPAAAIDPSTWDMILGRLTPLFLAAENDNPLRARDAAINMLACYQVATAEELGVAAGIISLRLHALEAGRYAADRGLADSKLLRLRGSMVSLTREAHKSERRMDQLRRARGALPVEVRVETALPAAHAANRTAADETFGKDQTPGIDTALEGPPSRSEAHEAARSDETPGNEAAHCIDITPEENGAPAKNGPPAVEKAVAVVEAARVAGRIGGAGSGPIGWSRDYQKREMLRRMAENARKNKARYDEQMGAAASGAAAPV